jgi:hypothetical protein
MEAKFLGTYSIRKIGKSEQGIHMPAAASGTYSIYQAENGDLILKKQDGVV